MSDSYDVIVVGGGVVGASAAYHAARQGARTLLVDRHDAGRASDAGAGILAPELSHSNSDAWYQFAVAAVQYYPDLLASLHEDDAGDTSYAQCGMLLVAVDEDEVPAYHQARHRILERQHRQGVPPQDDLRSVSATEARGLFPALADVVGAIYYRNAARVDGRLLGRALRRGAERHGLHVLDGDVGRLVIAQDRVQGVMVGEDELLSTAVIIASGAWSAQFGHQLGVRIPVEPQRGQIVHLDLAGHNTGAWPIVNAFRGHYIVAWPEGRVVAGATRETGSGYQPHTSAAGINEVLTEALRVAPGLAAARLHEVRVGLRPLSVDGLPVVGAVPGRPGIFLATGHGPTGLQLGPYTGKLVAGLALGTKPTIDLREMSVGRFGAP